MCLKKNSPHRLSVSALATVGAVLWGLYLFVATLFQTFEIQTIWFNSQTFSMVAQIFPGLIVPTITGAFLALLIGILCGALCFGIFGLFYNFLIDKCKYAKKY